MVLNRYFLKELQEIPPPTPKIVSPNISSHYLIIYSSELKLMSPNYLIKIKSLPNQ